MLLRIPLFVLPLALISCAIPPVTSAERLIPITIPEGAYSNELRLSTVVAKLTPGESIAKVQYGWMCLPTAPRQLPTGKPPMSNDNLTLGFKRVLEPLRYKIEQAPQSVFATRADQPAKLLVGATIQHLETNACFPFTGSPLLNVGDPSLAKGRVHMRITWELFSVALDKVVYTTTTTGTFEAGEVVTGGIDTMYLNAFMASLTNLASDKEFTRHVMSPEYASMKSIPSGPRT